jgi:hypothetical protein
MMKQILIGLLVAICPLFILGQEKEDPSKMFRDIVFLEVDRAKFSPAKPNSPTPPDEDKGKKGKKKKVEIVEPAADTLGPMMPAPPEEIVKRAQNWYNSKNTKFVKSNGANVGNTVSCLITFPYKQKVLNPENDVDGKITMEVLVDAKDGKYRYTVKSLKHKANKQGMSGGDVYAVVPECGSMNVNDRTWKHIKAAAFANAQVVIDDLKAKMKEDIASEKEEW